MLISVLLEAVVCGVTLISSIQPITICPIKPIQLPSIQQKDIPIDLHAQILCPTSLKGTKCTVCTINGFDQQYNCSNVFRSYFSEGNSFIIQNQKNCSCNRVSAVIRNGEESRIIFMGTKLPPNPLLMVSMPGSKCVTTINRLPGTRWDWMHCHGSDSLDMLVTPYAKGYFTVTIHNPRHTNNRIIMIVQQGSANDHIFTNKDAAQNGDKGKPFLERGDNRILFVISSIMGALVLILLALVIYFGLIVDDSKRSSVTAASDKVSKTTDSEQSNKNFELFTKKSQKTKNTTRSSTAGNSLLLKLPDDLSVESKTLHSYSDTPIAGTSRTYKTENRGISSCIDPMLVTTADALTQASRSSGSSPTEKSPPTVWATTGSANLKAGRTTSRI